MKYRWILIFNIVFLFGMTCFFFLFYGPLDEFRNFWITTSMKTKSHHYFATTLYDDKTIQRVLLHNRTIEVDEVSNLSKITFDSSSSYISKWDREIKTHDDNALYKIISIRGSGYHGKLVAIYDASKVKLAVSKTLNESGQFITEVARDNHAIIAMNASGYLDQNWNSNGSIAHGAVIQNGKLISHYTSSGTGGGIVGFTKDHKLFLGKVTVNKALALGVRDAVEFGPFLLVNGKSSTFIGNGGWGRAPRTAIGQRKDGIVLFLVINGRIPTSIGATMNDLVDIMKKYGAVNAVNMDGGSSSELLVKDKIINKPVGGGRYGLRAMPTFWVVTN